MALGAEFQLFSLESMALHPLMPAFYPTGALCKLLFHLSKNMSFQCALHHPPNPVFVHVTASLFNSFSSLSKLPSHMGLLKSYHT